MIKRFLQMTWLSVKLGKLAPFRIYSPSQFRIRSGAKINFQSRVTLGNRRNQLAVSASPISISIGREAKVDFHEGVSFGPGVKLTVKPRAEFSIGQNTYITSDTHIEVVNKITIGSHCAISWDITIIDDNHHKFINPLQKEKEVGTEVHIGDHVWIGCGCILLPGTTLGNNCVVAAGSVVKGNFPANTLVAGNPAKIIKEGVNWS